MGSEFQFIQVTGTQGGALVVRCRYPNTDIRIWTLDSQDEHGQPYYAQSKPMKTGDGQTVEVAVFPGLPAGNYEVYNPHGSNRRVTVFPGAVAEVSL